MQSTYLLVAHGSHDPRPQIALENLAQHIKNRSQTTPFKKSVYVGTATLECAPMPLHQQIQHFSQQMAQMGCTQIQVLPLFLLPGVHVLEDVPKEVAIAQQNLHPEIQIQLYPYLGSNLEALTTALAKQIATIQVDQWILMAHGSRRPNAHEQLETLAEQLNAIPAYWSVGPSLESQILMLIESGIQRIGILPYFIFSGGITDAIAQQVNHLSQQFPQVTFHLAEPLERGHQFIPLIEQALGIQS